MKVAHLCSEDCKGAGTAASRIHRAQWKLGLDSTLLLLRAWHPSVHQRIFNAPPEMILTPESGKPVEHAGVYVSATQWMEQLKAYPHAQKELELFSSPDAVTNIASCAVIRDADIVQLHWIPGVINFSELPQSFTQKPIVWRFSDLNPFTGGCHYARGCRAYEFKCGSCPQLGSDSQHDLSRIQWLEKARAYSELNLTCVAPSEWIANRCRKSGLLGTRPIEIIPNCVPLDIFHPQQNGDVRRKLGIALNHKVLLFAAAGLLNNRKGFKHIINALINLAQNGEPPFSLLSFGSVPDDLAIDLPFPWHILPSLDKDEDIASAFSCADAFLFTPEEENFPSVALESLACGTPVIGFATGGTPEIVEDGISGYLCSTGDDISLVKNIHTLLHLPDVEYKAFRAQCRKRAELFSEDTCARRYAALYNTLLGKSRPNAVAKLTDEAKVNIICYEDTKSWILGKFAEKMDAELHGLNVKSEIRAKPDGPSLVSHHIPNLGWHEEDYSLIRTVMITHVDTPEKLDLIKRQLVLADMGICMSEDTMDKLLQSGVPSGRLCFIHPPHDGMARPRKIRLGITSRLYADARKRENMLEAAFAHIPADMFEITIMGSGWEKQIAALTSHGVESTYYPEFNKEIYNSLFERLDYYLYLGMDEGSMGFLDAMSAGVPAIVTAQGYHLEAAQDGNIYFNTLDELVKILNGLAERKMYLRSSVARWTWGNYAKAHLMLWNYLIDLRSGGFNRSFRSALDNPDLPSRRDRLLVAEGEAPAGAWLTTAHVLFENGAHKEGLHALRHFLVANPDDAAAWKLYEQWLNQSRSAGVHIPPLEVIS